MSYQIADTLAEASALVGRPPVGLSIAALPSVPGRPVPDRKRALECPCKAAWRFDPAHVYGYCAHQKLMFARGPSGAIRSLTVTRTEWRAVARFLRDQSLALPLIVTPAVIEQIDPHHPVLTGTALVFGAPMSFFQRQRSGNSPPKLSQFEVRVRARKAVYAAVVTRPASLAKATAARRAAAKPVADVGERQQRRRRADRDPMAILARFQSM